MIPVPAKWSSAVRLDELILTPPEGPRVARIRYRERLPLRRPRDVVAERLAAARDVSWGALRPIERVITHEGEQGALVVVDGQAGEAPARRVFGMTLGDDIASVLDADIRDRTFFDRSVKLVRTLLRRDSLGLGVLRRRRFFFRPPAGWHIVGRNLLAELYPPDFPRNATMITVFPASPSRALPKVVLDQTMTELVRAGAEPRARGPTAIANELLEGSRWTVTTRDFVRELAVFADGRFLYPVQMEHEGERAAESQPVLDALLGTVEPIAEPEAAATVEAATPVGHWAD